MIFGPPRLDFINVQINLKDAMLIDYSKQDYDAINRSFDQAGKGS